MAKTSEIAKEAAGKAASELIQDGMLVGLGTGSTATHFIRHLIARCEQGLRIKAVATSKRSLQQAKEGKIPIVEIDNLTSLDIVVDGADEIDPQKRMIKGGGGALLREKIVANMSNEMVVIADESKLVEKLGTTYPLPIEIVPFAYRATLANIEEAGYHGDLRLTDEDAPYITDNGNYIFDIQFDQPRDNPENDQLLISQIPGVIETGFFFGLAGRVIIGYEDGSAKIRS